MSDVRELVGRLRKAAADSLKYQDEAFPRYMTRNCGKSPTRSKRWRGGGGAAEARFPRTG